MGKEVLSLDTISDGKLSYVPSVRMKLEEHSITSEMLL